MTKTYPSGDPEPVKHPTCDLILEVDGKRMACNYKAGGYTQEQADAELRRHQERVQHAS